MTSRLLSKRAALVTGSTSGIGLAIANSLAAAGSNVMLNGFGSEDTIRSLVESMESKHDVKVSFHEADLSQPKEAMELVQQTQRLFGSLDILVNNAGIQHVNPVQEFPDDMWEKVLAINLSSNFYTSKHSLKSMRANKFGRIINVSSAHGKVASANKCAYVAAKHGVLGLTKVLALETALDQNLTCNAICPGWVLTPLVEAQLTKRAAESGMSIKEATKLLLSEKQPSLEFVRPEDVGALAVFLCTDAARQMTGEAIGMDGGWCSQ
eukprot:gb/GEZN01013169.1/.p1 GENE.gb/GEZN01013169.1/~~gb/GEZN01013169.1/.p1  ORF type:complete len:277 (-),score=54.01 gb/GEZN01013169.1/:198-995(-)